MVRWRCRSGMLSSFPIGEGSVLKNQMCANGTASSMWRFFFFKQKTAYEITANDWSSDVCSSDLAVGVREVDADGHRVIGDANGDALVAQSSINLREVVERLHPPGDVVQTDLALLRP